MKQGTEGWGRVASWVVVAAATWTFGAGQARAAEPAAAPAAPAPVTRLGPPEGAFVGVVAGPGGAIEVRVVIAAGMVVDGSARLPDGSMMRLLPAGSPAARPVRLGGAEGKDYLRIAIDFFDEDRGAASCEGVLARKRFTAAWVAERR